MSVDVITGALVDTTADVWLDTPFPFAFQRRYNSHRNGHNSGIGWGHAHSFEAALRITFDNGIRYTAFDGTSIAFPLLMQDGARAAKQGHVLERVNMNWFRVHLPEGEEILEFEFWNSWRPARLVGITHPKGATRVFYDRQTGLLAGFTDSLNRSIRINWTTIRDPHGRGRDRPHIASLVLHASAAGPNFGSAADFARTHDLSDGGAERVLVAYRYDAWGRLLGGTDAYRNSFVFEYDDQTRMSRRVDQRGYAFFYEYDHAGRCIHSGGEDGVEEVRLEYTEGITTVKRADGGEWLYQHTGGFIERIVDPLGGERQRELDDGNLLSGEVDEVGRRFSVVRDSSGKALGRRDSKGVLWPMGEAPAPPSHEVPASACEWEYGRIIAPGHGLPVRRHLEAAWLPAVVVDAFTPPSKGEGLSYLEEHWEETTVRDLQGLRLRVERPGTTARRSWHYDKNGFWTRYTDFDCATWQRSFVSWNHLREEIDPLGGVTRFEHSKREKLVCAVDPSGVESRYDYDLVNRLAGIWRHGKWRERYTHDAAGELEEKVDGRGQWMIRYKREDEGRKVTRWLAHGERHEMTYTATRQLQSAVVEAADGKKDTYTFAYGIEGMRLRDERNTLGVRRRFRAGRLAEMQVLERFVTRYNWVNDGTLEIVDPTGAKQFIQRHDGGVVRRTTSNRVTEFTHYHPDGYCLSKMAMAPSGGLWKRIYQRSQEGDLLENIDSLRGQRSFRYDAAHRLIGEILPDGTGRTFEHTAGGDLVAAPGLTGVTLDEHRLHDANGSRFEYDHRDHMAAIHSPHGVVYLRHDARDQLVLVQGAGIGTWTARYDVLGRRIETVHNGRTTTFYWDTDRLAAEVLPDGHLRVYIYADEFALSPFMFVDYASVDAAPESGKRYFILANHLGTPEMVQDDAGVVVWRAWYEAYGLAHVEIGGDFHQPLRWPGHYFDAATRLHYNRFRYYSPDLGRYVESDPDGIRGGLNLHAYCEGNPLRFVDVRGLGCGSGKGEGNEEEGNPEKEQAARKSALAERRAKMQAERIEKARNAALDEAIAKAQKRGAYDRLSDDDKAFVDQSLENHRLAVDPDGNGKYHVDEARVARRAEQDGSLKPPVRRATDRADPREAGGDLVAGDGSVWDVKDSRAGVDKIASVANGDPPHAPENVLVDCKGLSDSEYNQLVSDINGQLRPNAGDVRFVR